MQLYSWVRLVGSKVHAVSKSFDLKIRFNRFAYGLDTFRSNDDIEIEADNRFGISIYSKPADYAII